WPPRMKSTNINAASILNFLVSSFMRIFIFLLPFCFAITGLRAQVTAAQQTILNNYLVYANQSGEEVTTTVNALAAYYPIIFQKRSWGDPKFVCPVQLENYYYDK